MRNLLDKLTHRRLAVLMIVIPLLLAAAYFGIVAEDRYVSESIVTVRQADQSHSSFSGLSTLLGGVTGASHEDVVYLRRYVLSADMLGRLDQQLGLRKYFEHATHDPLQQLPANATREDFLEYFQNHIELLYDDSSSMLTLKVQAFDPQFAQKLNRAIVAESERFVNSYSRHIAGEQLSFAERELNRMEGRLTDAKKSVLSFQAQHKVLDPMAQAQAAGAVDSQLRATLVKLEAEEKGLLAYLNEDSFQVASLRNQISAIRAQIQQERASATSGPDSLRVNALAAEYHGLMQNVAFAEGTYKLALTAVEAARMEATRKLKGMVTIQSPTLPERAEYPRRIYNLATLLVVTALLYAIVTLILATIREHQY